MDPDDFFPTRTDHKREALKVCANCIVKRPCLDDALATDGDIPQSIRGGMYANDRKKLLIKMRKNQRQEKTG